MKTIFAKYNSERLPKYQIVTKIAVDENGEKYASKEALCNEAKEHIEDIYRNYELLKSTYNINFVKPKRIENGVQFEMAEGKSLESILLDAINKNDKDMFKKYIDNFLNFIDSMVFKWNVPFDPSFEFETIFGKWEITENQDIIKIANIDLIFGNLFINTKDEFTLIDYEWVFDFEIPKSYLIWRSLTIFSEYHSIDLSKFNSHIDDLENKQFLKYDEMFSDFVHGKYKKYFLAPKVAKDVNFINLERKKENYFIQLFIEDDNGLSEENSIKYPVMLNNKIQKFEFDLKDKNNIKSLRLDPLNDFSIVKINQIYFNNIASQDFTNSNAIFNEDNVYFFNTDDSQIYINLPFNVSINTFSIEIQYLKIGKDSVNDISNAFHKILESKEQIIQNLNNKIENNNIIIQNQNKELESKEQIIQSLEDELIAMYKSKSWNSTRILRNFIRMLKK